MTSSSKSLGRGLDILLSARAAPRAPATLPLAAIRPGTSQPRGAIRRESLDELAASIKSNGVLQPILVRPFATDGPNNRSYEIVAGERRWQAAKLAGLTEIPVVIRELSDKDAVAAALIENIQREDLTAGEEARALQRLLNEFSLTHEQVADAVGRSRAAVTNLLRLLDLPAAVLTLIDSRSLGMGHARALLGLNTDAERTRVGQLVASKGLSVRDTEALVRRTQRPTTPDTRPLSAVAPALTVMSEVLRTPDLCVRLQQGQGEDLAEQEAAALANRDFTSVLALQERTQPLIDFVVTTGASAASRPDLRLRLTTLHGRRRQTGEALAAEMERTRGDLQQTQIKQRKIARIMPVYGQTAAVPRRLQAIG